MMAHMPERAVLEAISNTENWAQWGRHFGLPSRLGPQIKDASHRYVLTTFVVVPIRWLDRYGWRPLSEHERHATAGYYRELGRRMNIADIPGSYAEFVDYAESYERGNFRYSDASRRTAEATRELLVSWFPRPLAPLTRAAATALLDPPLLAAFGFDPPPAWLRRSVDGALRARARVERRLPPRRRPVQAGSPHRQGVGDPGLTGVPPMDQATMPCGSRTYFFAAPWSKSAYPWGAWSSGITVALTALAICTLSWRIAFIRP